MPVRHLRGVRRGEGALAGRARGDVGPEREGHGLGEGRQIPVGDRPERLEVLDDARQLGGEPLVLPVGEVERGEPRNPLDELAVDPHGGEYSQRLDASGSAPLPSPAVSALPEPRDALRRLARRRAVRLAVEAAADAGTSFLVVGGAVRDALLGLPPGDLDLAVPRESAAAFAEALARRGRVRAVAIGRVPRRILHVPLRGASADIWETEGHPEGDLLRRDFTVNALALVLPEGRLASVPGALEDLSARRLRLPRPGVLLEDPLRVVRAARFLERLPGFRIDASALPELRRAAPLLAGTSPERRLAELDAILSAGPAAAGRALERLERWGALAALMPGVVKEARRRGLALLASAKAPAEPALLRAILLAPAGPAAAASALEALRASRRDLRLAATLLALPSPSGGDSRRAAVLLLRRAAPFSREAAPFAAAVHGAKGRALARAAETVLGGRRGLDRALKPRRPIGPDEVARLSGASGPELGRLLDRLDEALATGQVRGRRAARALVARLSGAGGSRPRDVSV